MRAKPSYILAVAVLVAVAAGGAYFVTRQKPASPAPQPVPGATPSTDAVSPPADCLLPGPPPVAPDGRTASAAGMQLGHDVMQNFVNELEAYQACRNLQIDHAAPGVTAQQKQTWIDQGNAAVDQANDLAAAFSAQLKVFKARPPGQ